MTEDEAKTKWCPFVRAIGAVSDDAAANRWPTDPDGEFDDTLGLDAWGHPHALCIASQCMAWRTGPQLGERRDGGYCGLAGASA